MLQASRRALAPLLPFLVFLVAGLCLLSLSRAGLALWHFDAVQAARGWREVMLQGVRVDIATMSLFLGLAAGLYLLAPRALSQHRFGTALLAGWLALSLAVPATLEAATPAFMGEYGLRPNRMFIEYLSYPREVASTLAKGHLLTSLATLAIAALATWMAYRSATTLLRRYAQPGCAWPLRAAAAVIVIAVAALGVRSTLGHRPMNPAMVAFSTDATVNALALNSFYSVAFAARDWLRDDPGARIYDAETSNEAVLAAMREEALAWPGARVSRVPGPYLIDREPAYRGTRRNLVIVLEESLGAQFVGGLGGLPLTPNLDRLSTQGWAFDNLYATGTRSVRGIEAVLSGYPPSPSPAVVKQPLAQDNFFTLASLLGREGYDTTFHYGGESHFDNMRGFFLANGFERIVDQDDHRAPVFRGSWGVSDEDLFDRAHQDFLRLHQGGKPFFGFVFTSSNHDPFEFPKGRIKLHDAAAATRNNAAMYADHALGAFFEDAMASPYWRDTIFLVVADHDSRVFGRSLVPVDNFHIPGLVLGPGIEPRHDTRIASQIDLAPTLLSLLGIESPTPLLGRDLNRDDPMQPGRALMQYDDNFAWMSGAQVTILQPGKPARGFVHRPGQPLVPAMAPPPAVERRARMHALWSTVAYQQHWHRLPPPS